MNPPNKDIPGKPSGNINVQRGVRFAVRMPRESSEFLSKVIHEETVNTDKFDAKMRLTFATHLLGYVADADLYHKVNKKSLTRIKEMPLKKAVKLAVRNPEGGVRYLAAIVYEELVLVQKYSMTDVIKFTTSFLGNVLRELKESK